MKRIPLDRWASHIQPPRNPRLHLPQQRCLFSSEAANVRQPSRGACVRHRREYVQQQHHPWQPQRRGIASKRRASSAATAPAEGLDSGNGALGQLPPEQQLGLRTVASRSNAPSPRRATQSAKLAALHARLALPSKLPLQTLARCLIDPSAEPQSSINNAPLAVLGQDLLGYYTSEYLLCHYPRLPMPILFAAQYAYIGHQTLSAIRAEWGVEAVAAPGQEVDPGLLQLRRMPAGNAMAENGMTRLKDMPQARRLGTGRRNEEYNYRRGMSSRIVYDDQFGDLNVGLPPSDSPPFPAIPTSTSATENSDATTTSGFESPTASDSNATTLEAASASFIRALAGALYLHAGVAAAKSFHSAHILSRQLPLHTLFHFTHPTRDLSRLCARENFEPPVARLISETGRLSRTPVFVVGVFSGDDKLGEGAGGSLNEARVRAAAAALRSWYLYSPPEREVVLPSEVEEAAEVNGGRKKEWRPQMVDMGEVVT